MFVMVLVVIVVLVVLRLAGEHEIPSIPEPVEEPIEVALRP
jgi:hypothetical protein